MAIAIDATSSGATTGTSLTVSHTCAVGATALIVMGMSANVSSITGITYNGVAMTKRVESNFDGQASIWTLDAPASGTNDIVMSVGSSLVIGLGAASITGAYGLSATGTNSGTGTSVTQTTATAETAGIVFACVRTKTTATSISYTGGGSSISTLLPNSSVYESYTSSANPTQTWTLGASRDWQSAYLEVYAGPTTSIKTFDGLAYASTKTVNGLAIASVKTWSGLA